MPWNSLVKGARIGPAGKLLRLHHAQNLCSTCMETFHTCLTTGQLISFTTELHDKTIQYRSGTNLTGLVPISIVADEQCLEQDLASWISDCDIIKLVCGGESETTGCVGDGILEFGLGGDPLLTGDPLQLLWLLLLPGEVRLLMASEKLPRCPQMALKYFTLKDPNKNLHRCWLSSARSL